MAANMNPCLPPACGVATALDLLRSGVKAPAQSSHDS